MSDHIDTEVLRRDILNGGEMFPRLWLAIDRKVFAALLDAYDERDAALAEVAQWKAEAERLRSELIALTYDPENNPPPTRDNVGGSYL